MRKGIILALATTAVGFSSYSIAASEDIKTDPFRKKAEDIVSKLDVESKISLLAGPGWGAGPINAKYEVDGVAGYINGVYSEELGVDIASMSLADGPAGLRISPTREGEERTYYATAWPIGTLLASTWDQSLVEEVGNAFGSEAREYGVDLILGPGMNLQRNPLNGRNFEYYSEDPLVSGRTAAAMVRGIQSNGVGATLKHYFANNSETNRRNINAVGTPRTWRELYLRGYQIAVEESAPWAVMTSYNKVNGTYANERYDSNTDILRNEWGFNGLVMSDWGGGDVTNAAHLQVISGQDVIMPGGSTAIGRLTAFYEAGELPIEAIDKATVNILTRSLRSVSNSGYRFSNDPDLAGHIPLARQAATEGMVLLKNDAQALPLKAGSNIAPFGITQINTYKGGTGSGDVNAAYINHLYQGLSEQFEIDEPAVNFYQNNKENYCEEVAGHFGSANYWLCEEAPFADLSAAVNIEQAALDNEAAVIAIGRQAGEGGDRDSGPGDYYLNQAELDLIDNVSKAFKAQDKPVVVVLNVNAIVDVTQWQDKVDAILLAYMGGQETGNAVADLLSGQVTPSGKLAITMPTSYDYVPSADVFPGLDTTGDGSLDTLPYGEGIYVGYRYYTSMDAENQVEYPFGYGLSYTTFDYSSPRVVSNTLHAGGSGRVKLEVMVENNGNVSGKEAVQVYVSAPEVNLDKPLIELKSFAKTDELLPGRKQKLHFEISPQLLASFDEANDRWVIEPGVYKAYIAPSSDVSGIKPLTFTVAKEIMVSPTTPGALALEDTTDTNALKTVYK